MPQTFSTKYHPRGNTIWFIRQQHTSDILLCLFDIAAAYAARRSTMLLCISIAVAVLVQPLYTGREQSLGVAILLGAKYDLYPPILRQNFRLMGATFGRGLNHNSDRNTGVVWGYTSYLTLQQVQTIYYNTHWVIAESISYFISIML